MRFEVTSQNTQIVLASGSPRRLELMRLLGFDPRVRVSAVAEVRAAHENGEAYTRRLCLEKAQTVASTLNELDPAWILAADTVVEFEDTVLEKPEDFDHACAMLRQLSGREHTVTTSFCWLNRMTQRHEVVSVAAGVTFRSLDDEAIANYVRTGEPMDKAGAYGIQGVGAFLVASISGSYHTIVGLPICEVVTSLQALGGLGAFPFSGER